MALNPTPSQILYHITIAGKPMDLVQTARGVLTYASWCESERRRIVNKGNWPDAEKAVVLYTNPRTGEIDLVHLRVKAGRT
jgi:hypothetical protein